MTLPTTNSATSIPGSGLRYASRILELKVMNELFSVGDDYLARLEEARASEKRKREARMAGGSGEAATKKGPGLRETDPW